MYAVCMSMCVVYVCDVCVCDVCVYGNTYGNACIHTETRGVMHHVLVIQCLPTCFMRQVLTLAWDSLIRLMSLGNVSLHFVRAEVPSVCCGTKSFDVGFGIQLRSS